MFGPVLKVFHYAFGVTPPVRNDTAQRSGFMQYQTFPDNTVQGRGVLYPGTIHAYQPPQVIVDHKVVISDVMGGGHYSGAIAMQPLIKPNKPGGAT